ncbi:hypothetical protein RHMOL_Rhmol03G0006400 [Rhododendron molle]|uniref:Uncharacterized protein n=1 Tax=Rhododendron molle TaxID=49168 RepID=A0ACC0PA94_RHOML|nr:hypothetical protein RHMOL_Rhmol03G0006400 [Rhododendron molle]
MGFSKDNLIGFLLALSSSAFIGGFIIKKKGLRKAAAASGVRAGVGGYSYLMEPLWWLGMITTITGEVANFVAYAFAPAVLVTPLVALSIIISAVLAHCILKEKLHQLGVLGCVMCIAGSVIIVIHAPQERPITSVQEVWTMATQPAFLLYVGSVIVLVFILIFYFAPQPGHSNVMVFTGICSLMGSLSRLVLGISLNSSVIHLRHIGFEKTDDKSPQGGKSSTVESSLGKHSLILVGNVPNLGGLAHFGSSVLTLNMFGFTFGLFFLLIGMLPSNEGRLMLMKEHYQALDTLNTAIVSPIYYVMFTSLTIIASIIMFKDWDGQSGGSIVSNICGFIVVLSGTILLHVTRDFDRSSPFKGNYAPLSPSFSAGLCNGNGELSNHEEEDEPCSEEVCLRRQELYP